MANDEEDFATLLAEFEPPKKQQHVKVGDLVRAKVVKIGGDAVFVDLGAKSEGMIDIVELRDADGKLTVAVGDTVEARVVETAGKAGCVVLKRTLGKGPQAKAELLQAFQHGIPVEGTITGVNKGGVEVQVAGERGFCPISQLDLVRVEDATPWIGRKLTFKITKYQAGDLVVSRRSLLEEERAGKAAETRAKLTVGAVFKGTVTSLKDYGAFVDLGGLEGMIHVSELGFQRVAHPKEVLSPGQPVEVQVVKIDGERIGLSLKSLEKDPWTNAPQPGTRMAGKVTRLETFGAFVELAPGLEGLVHISELGAGKHVVHPREVVKIGQPVTVTVLNVDPEKRRIGLSMQEAEEKVEIVNAPSSFGTLGDLLKPKPKQKK